MEEKVTFTAKQAKIKILYRPITGSFPQVLFVFKCNFSNQIKHSIKTCSINTFKVLQILYLIYYRGVMLCYSFENVTIPVLLKEYCITQAFYSLTKHIFGRQIHYFTLNLFI